MECAGVVVVCGGERKWGRGFRKYCTVLLFFFQVFFQVSKVRTYC